MIGRCEIPAVALEFGIHAHGHRNAKETPLIGRFAPESGHWAHHDRRAVAALLGLRRLLNDLRSVKAASANLG